MHMPLVHIIRVVYRIGVKEKPKLQNLSSQFRPIVRVYVTVTVCPKILIGKHNPDFVFITRKQ